jgi:hypothetical protein
LAGGSVLSFAIGAMYRHPAQRLTPEPLLGRVYSASRPISWGVLPVGAAAAGIAAELVGIRTVFALGAIVSVVMLVMFILVVSDREPQGTGARPDRE